MLHRHGPGLVSSAGSRWFSHSSRALAQRSSDNVQSPSHDIAILGGGISGLATAYYLTKEHPKARIRIYESSERLGGWAHSKRVPVKDGSVIFESGVRSLRPAKNGVLTIHMMQDLGLAKDAIFTHRQASAACNRFVYYPDRIVRMPHPAHGLVTNMHSLLTEPVFDTVAWSLMTEFTKAPRDSTVEDESIGDFFSRRLSKTMVDRLLSAVIHGIYAGDVWKLSAKSLFRQQWYDEAASGGFTRGYFRTRAEGFQMTQRDIDFMERADGSHHTKLEDRLASILAVTSVFTFRNGLQTLIDRLAEYLFESGQVEFCTGTPVQAIKLAQNNSGVDVRTGGLNPGTRRHTHVISSLPPERLNSVAQSSSSASLSNKLIPTIPSVTVMTVNLYFQNRIQHDLGFGYLIPQATPFENNPERALGVVVDSSYSPSQSECDQSFLEQEAVVKLDKETNSVFKVGDFAWYNLNEKLVGQDHVKPRGTKLTVMLGGHWWDGWSTYPDEKEGLALARSLLERHLGLKEEPLAWQVNLEKDCIPQYTVGHEQRLKQAHNNLWREYNGKVRVVGNWVDGVGFNDCVRTAYEVARNIGKAATGLEHVGEEPNMRVKFQAIK